MPKRVHVYVSGRVQGVYFRQGTRDKAVLEGVAGWVRNLGDGRVEAVFEGDAGAVERVVNWCRAGPEGARVDEVVLDASGDAEGLEVFSVRY